MGEHCLGELTVSVARGFVSDGGGQPGFHKTRARRFDKNNDAGFGHP
jgi:hypothetical protein